MPQKLNDKTGPSLNSLCEQFSGLPDPRQQGKISHLLGEVLICALCSTICGAKGAEAMEEFTRSQLGWLRGFLLLEHGAPSHDTFRNVLNMVDPAAFSAIMGAWGGDLAGRHVAVDGKVLRGAGGEGGTAPCLVRAWVDELSLGVGHVACSEKSNEIEAIPRLLDALVLGGTTVTIDAAGCQKAIAAKIDAAEASYVLALKGNHKGAHAAVRDHFKGGGGSQAYRTEEFSHGRYEVRTCTVEDDLGFFGKAWTWEGLGCVAHIRSEVCRPGARGADGAEATVEDRYYLCSTPADAALILGLARAHWGIENRCHWTLDVVFGEDACQVRDRTGARNLSTLRDIAAHLIRKDGSRGSLPRKMLRAALDPDFRFQIISNVHA